MPRQNRAFTVEIKGRRKSAAFDWKSAVAAAETPPVLREVSRSPATAGVSSGAPTPRRILPALPRTDTVPDAPLATTRRARRDEDKPLPPVAASASIDEAVPAPQPPVDRPAEKATGPSDRAEPSMTPSPIRRMCRTDRIALALSRAEKWKRRLPAILR